MSSRACHRWCSENNVNILISLFSLLNGSKSNRTTSAVPVHTDRFDKENGAKKEKISKRSFSEVRILPFDIKAAEKVNSIAVKLLAVGREINAL
ncbi:hypothetical protein [Ferroglobus sp.]|uniref:hypothetical protein n=1 Tax=Ferroglobus sp. TaxID=2614230 RepID=UPI0025BDA6A9|nr:hypothetical protein [Ferroglobus sp.]